MGDENVTIYFRGVGSAGENIDFQVGPIRVRENNQLVLPHTTVADVQNRDDFDQRYRTYSWIWNGTPLSNDKQIINLDREEDEFIIRLIDLRRWLRGGLGKKNKKSKKRTKRSSKKRTKRTKRSSKKSIGKRRARGKDESARGKNKELEKLWTDMSNMTKLVFIMKIKQLDGSYYKIHKIKRTNYQDKIDEGNNTPSVKAILTAGNSFDGYQQLYDKVKDKSVRDVLKYYKKYWKYNLGDKLFTC